MGSCGRAELRIGHLGIWVKAGEGREWRRVERRLKEEREELKHKGDAENGNADGFWWRLVVSCSIIRWVPYARTVITSLPELGNR